MLVGVYGDMSPVYLGKSFKTVIKTLRNHYNSMDYLASDKNTIKNVDKVLNSKNIEELESNYSKYIDDDYYLENN